MFSLRCGLGFHQWGSLGYTGSKCCQERCVCARCQAIKEGKTRHQWTEWAKSSCKTERYCVRCDLHEEKEPAHQWQGWMYKEESNCHMQRICQECGASQHIIQHQWGEVQFREEITDAPFGVGGGGEVFGTFSFKTCLRCGSEEGNSRNTLACPTD